MPTPSFHFCRISLMIRLKTSVGVDSRGQMLKRIHKEKSVREKTDQESYELCEANSSQEFFSKSV